MGSLHEPNKGFSCGYTHDKIYRNAKEAYLALKIENKADRGGRKGASRRARASDRTPEI